MDEGPGSDGRDRRCEGSSLEGHSLPKCIIRYKCESRCAISVTSIGRCSSTFSFADQLICPRGSNAYVQTHHCEVPALCAPSRYTNRMSALISQKGTTISKWDALIETPRRGCRRKAHFSPSKISIAQWRCTRKSRFRCWRL